jgi:hypothetical protein
MYATTNMTTTVENDVPLASGTLRAWVTRNTTPVTAKAARAPRIGTCRAETSSSSNVGSRLTTWCGPATSKAALIAMVATTRYPMTAAMTTDPQMSRNTPTPMSQIDQAM